MPEQAIQNNNHGFLKKKKQKTAVSTPRPIALTNQLHMRATLTPAHTVQSIIRKYESSVCGVWQPIGR